MSFGQLAGAIARRIVGGEKPSFVSARDGRLLRRVPGRVRVDNSTLAVHIEGALQEVPGLAAIVEMATGSTGTRCNQETTSIKSLLYLARCHAYRRAGQASTAAGRALSAPHGLERGARPHDE